MKSALSSKVKEDNIIVVDELTFAEPKTKLMIETLKALNASKKTLVVTADGDVNVTKSARNIPGVKPWQWTSLMFTTFCIMTPYLLLRTL